MFISSFIFALFAGLIASIIVGAIFTNAVAAIAAFYIAMSVALFALMVCMARKKDDCIYADFVRDGC